MYKVCDSCAAAIVNDDFSGMDEETATSVDAWLEVVGMLAFSEQEIDTTGQGYWRCAACGCDEIGVAKLFEPVGA